MTPALGHRVTSFGAAAPVVAGRKGAQRGALLICGPANAKII
jgi:hypothetical protein